MTEAGTDVDEVFRVDDAFLFLAFESTDVVEVRLGFDFEKLFREDDFELVITLGLAEERSDFEEPFRVDDVKLVECLVLTVAAVALYAAQGSKSTPGVGA